LIVFLFAYKIRQNCPRLIIINFYLPSENLMSFC